MRGLAKMNWILSGNINRYDIIAKMEESSYVYWNQKRNYEVGDFVYIYLSAPIQEIRYKFEVTATDLLNEECDDDSNFWASTAEFENTTNNRNVRFDLLKQTRMGMTRTEMSNQGIMSRIQGPIRISDELANYIDENYFEDNNEVVYPEEISSEEFYKKGQYKEIKTNRYERNVKARQKCLDTHGYNCKVCDFNFQQVYGEIGKRFIHVHHIKPVSEIKGEYVIDPINDLVPVCPNCHAMLHSTKIDGLNSVVELKNLLEKRREKVI